MNIVLYCEGNYERGRAGMRLQPLDLLPPEGWGPAHHIVARLVKRARADVPLSFWEPLRLDGRVPSGSDLHKPKNLKKLLSFPARRPELCVVLVDRDEDNQRHRALTEGVSSLHVTPKAILVPREEFEAWLLADQSAVRAVLSAVSNVPPEPENLPPKRAKELINRWTTEHGFQATEVRTQIAQSCSLQELLRLRSAQQALTDLESALR